MFWKYNHQSSPHIDTLLNKDDVTLQELMDEEDVLQECKVQNKKLIDFLVRPEIMEELVRLATVEPCEDEDVDEKQRYKYPNVACELLTCDVPTLNERLAGDEELLGKLYTFLEAEAPLNPLLASFFSKTFGVLVARKSEQNWYSYQFTCLQVLEFLKSKENFIPLLLKHLGTSAIMDLLLKLITHIEGAELKQNILSWLDSQQVIQCLVGLLDPKVDSERNCNAAQLLCDVIRMARENQHNSQEKNEPDPILNRVEDPETVSQLLEHMLGPEKRESSIVGGVTVLLTLLDCTRPSHEPSNAEQNNLYCNEGQHGEEPTPGETEQASKVIASTLDAILPRLKDFHNLLLDPPSKPAVKTTVGVLDPPLGNTRLHIAKLLATLVASNHSTIDRELAELGTVETLLDLFFKYTWNNFLHSQVEQCLAHALSADVTPKEGGEEETQNNILLRNIFIKCRLLQRILEAWEDNENQQSKSGGLRRGYMGHLIKIANVVAAQVEKGSLASFMAEHVPAETVTAWEAFTASTLAETNKTHTISLGGSHPVHSSSEDDDQEYRDIPFPPDTIQQAFTEFQMQQMTPQYIESFGFNDDEFIDGDEVLHTSVDRLTSMTFTLSDTDLDRQTEMFKKVCSGKMRSIAGVDVVDMWDEEEPPFPSTDQTNSWHEGSGDAANSSDEEEEEEREDPEGSDEIHMEVDTTDPWPAAGLSSAEVPSGAVAVDTVNPWSTEPAPSDAGEAAAQDQGGWANFGAAGFADFDANFAAPVATASQSAAAVEMVIADSSVSSTAAVLDNIVDRTDACPALPSSPKPDNNANSSSYVEAHPHDNQRFVVSQKSAVSEAAGNLHPMAEGVHHSSTTVVTENGPVSVLHQTTDIPSPAAASEVQAELSQSPAKSEVSEESTNVVVASPAK